MILRLGPDPEPILMSNPSLRKVPPLFVGVIPSKTYDAWAGDPIFLGWGSDPDL